MGSRYGGLKQMDPMGPNGETVLDYSVYDAIRAGFGKVVFIIRRDFEEAFRNSIIAKFQDQIETDIVFQELHDLPEGFTPPQGRTKPWGTSHAIRAARNAISTPFAVINADDFYGADSYAKAATFLSTISTDQSKQSAYGMVTYLLKNTLSKHGGVNRGIVSTTADNQLTDVCEIIDIATRKDGNITGTHDDGTTKTLTTETHVSMNLWAFTPQIFAQIEAQLITFLNAHGNEEKSECYIPTLVDELIKSGTATCTAIETNSSWFGVTYPQDKPNTVAAIQALVDAGTYPNRLT